MSQPSDLAAKRHARVLDAATEVFSRYGFARTTMQDIAEQAGMSRPALYLDYANKDSIFTAVVRRMNARQLANIRAAIAPLPGLRDKLLHACLTWGAHGVDLIEAHPDARDLFSLAFPAVQDMYDEFQVLLAQLLSEPAIDAALGASPAEVARAMTYAMRGFKDTATDGSDMRRLITLQVSLLAAALEPAPAGPTR